MSTLPINSDDVVWICGNLYCKTPEALDIALEQARSIGYEIKDSRTDESRATPEKMEQNGWSLWYASLDVRRAKCGSCGFYMSMAGTRVHGHTCENCGAVTYREIVEDSTVRFSFRGDEYVMFGPELVMKVKRWDDQNSWLYLKYGFEGRSIGTLIGDKAEAYLTEHAGKWELVEEDGERLLKVHYARGLYVQDDDVLNVRDIWGHEFNSTEVKVWDGKEYSTWDSLPVPESFSIYETWHWAPLGPSPDLYKRILSAAGQTSRKEYWYQDGRRAYEPRVFETMGIFVRHFTTLDADRWDRESKHFRLDGPGGIDDVAKFCDPNAVVETGANIGNFLTAITGLDRSATNRELAARALQEDEDTQYFVKGLIQDR
jgi:hypothetical protein